jgi:hypothetical protein
MGRLQLKYDLTAALAITFSKYLDVFEAYRLDENFDPQIGTTEAGMPLAKMSRPIMPSLVTSYLSGSSPDATSFRSCLAAKRPIVIEYWSETLLRWVFADAQDGLTIDADGTFHLPGLRELGRTYRRINPTFASGDDSTISDGCGGKLTEYLTAGLVARNIRLTVAIPLDHKLCQAYKLGCDPTQGVTTLKNKVDDSDRIDPTLSRLYYADTGSLYRKDIIAPGNGTVAAPGSWSIPQGIPQLDENGEEVDSAVADTPGTVQDDSVYISNHVVRKARDLGRLDRGGYLIIPHITPVFHVGDQIERLENIGGGGDYPINGCVQEIHYMFKTKPHQRTVLMIA